VNQLLAWARAIRGNAAARLAVKPADNGEARELPRKPLGCQARISCVRQLAGSLILDAMSRGDHLGQNRAACAHPAPAFRHIEETTRC